jgi:hypothetical protein
VHHAFWNDEALTGQKVDRSVFEIDDEASADNEEELVVVAMLMPIFVGRACDLLGRCR